MRSLLSFWLLCFLAGVASTTVLANVNHATRQAEALNKLFFDSGKLQRRAAVLQDSSATTDTLSSRLYAQNGLKENDRIDKLPGQPDGVDFDQYGGYVTVDAQAGRSLFYYLAEAATARRSSAPLLLWLNGGPGCSSLGYGAMEELGPFRVARDGKTLYRNPFAWNKAANVLFLESPAGVGFSYSNSSADYSTSGDRKTAEDAYVFLVNWLERFPEYKGRDFYLAGESYAGHYVPQLAQAILQHNNSIIALKGIMIGNAVINDETDNRGMYDYFWTHALISDQTINAIHKYCNFSPLARQQSSQCAQALDYGNNVFSTLNIYNIYAPLCLSPGVTPTPKRPSIRNFDPCSDYYVSAYLNNPSVQQALHANVTKLSYPWSSCSGLLFNWLDSPSTILPIINELLANSIRVWVYSGDIDGRIPVTSTRYSLNQLKLPVTSQWRPWNINNEIGGYYVIYGGNLTFVTIRGAGHEVPSYQPVRASLVVKYFLQGKPFST